MSSQWVCDNCGKTSDYGSGWYRLSDIARSPMTGGGGPDRHFCSHECILAKVGEWRQEYLDRVKT